MNAARTTNAAIRHQERIATVKRRIADATAAQQHAARRRDYETARMWLSHIAELQQQLSTLRTMGA